MLSLRLLGAEWYLHAYHVPNQPISEREKHYSPVCVLINVIIVTRLRR